MMSRSVNMFSENPKQGYLQIKIPIEIPFQMIGPGNNSPITTYFDCDTSAVRMCNLFIKSPWFSEVLLRV